MNVTSSSSDDFQLEIEQPTTENVPLEPDEVDLSALSRLLLARREVGMKVSSVAAGSPFLSSLCSGPAGFSRVTDMLQSSHAYSGLPPAAPADQLGLHSDWATRRRR